MWDGGMSMWDVGFHGNERRRVKDFLEFCLTYGGCGHVGCR